MEIVTYKKGNHIIKMQTIGDNNGLRNQIIIKTVNATIESIKIKEKLIVANGVTKVKTKFSSFYLTHLYEGTDKKIHCAGYYNKIKEPYKDDNLNGSNFSVNICLVDDLIF